MVLNRLDLYKEKKKPECEEKKIAKLPLFQFLNHVTCGFELETQQIHGKTVLSYDRQRDVPQRINETAYQEAINQRFSRLTQFPISELPYPYWRQISSEIVCRSDMVSFVKNQYPRQYARLKSSNENLFNDIHTILSTRGTKIQALLDYLAESGYSSLRGKKRTKIINLLKKSITEDRYSDFHRDNHLYVGREEFHDGDPHYTRMSEYFEYFSERRLPDRVEMVRDGSVSGPEIRTVGARTPVQFLKAAKALTNWHLKVDKGCSFHIHIGLVTPSGLTHEPNEEIQIYAFEYILRNVHKLPAEVKDRLTKNSRNNRKYYNFNLCFSNQTHKYFCVSKRAVTYEFRLWGNFNDFKNMHIALMTTIRAFYYALRVFYKLEKPVFRGLCDIWKDTRRSREWGDLVDSYLSSKDYENSISFERYVANHLHKKDSVGYTVKWNIDTISSSGASVQIDNRVMDIGTGAINYSVDGSNLYINADDQTTTGYAIAS